MTNLKDKLLLVLIMFLSFSSSALCIEIPDSMKQAMASETAGMPSMINLVLSMVIVIALIYATGWVYNKLNLVNRDKLNKLGADEFDKHKFSVLQTMPLGQHRYLYSIEMNEKVLLVGSTPSHISLIKEFSNEDKSEKLNLKDDYSQTGQHQDVDSNVQVTQKSDVNSKSSINIDDLYKKYKS